MTTSTVLDPATHSAVGSSEVIVSADSHVIEPDDLWATRLPEGLRDRAPRASRLRSDHPGGTDPKDRLGVMQRDTVSGEMIFPTHGLTQYAIEDAELQEACFRVYNDWIVEYCAGTPGRLWAIPSISTYNVEHAVKELERTAKLGMKGAELWYVPHPDLPYSSDHYERLWAAAQEMGAPITLHILSGFSYNRTMVRTGTEQYRGSVGIKLSDAINTLFDFIFYGALERYPRLKLVLAEAEIGWLPWLLQQWDYYVLRFKDRNPLPLSLLPSEYFQRQVYATFFNDAVGARNLSWWGQDNCMWSNDFPHGNSTWPHSREVIARDVAHLPADARAKLLRETVARIYGFPVPAPIETTMARA